MKYLRIFLILVVAVIFCTLPVDAKEKKIGFVDLSRVFDEYEKTKEFDQVLEKQHNEYQEMLKNKTDDIRDGQAKLALLKEEEKAKVQADLEKKKNELLEWDREQRTELTKKRDERVREILLEIENLVSDHAKKESYDMILNDRVLIYGSSEIDLTETILDKLNKKYKK